MGKVYSDQNLHTYTSDFLKTSTSNNSNGLNIIKKVSSYYANLVAEAAADFLQIDVLKNFIKFIEKQMCLSLMFIKNAVWRDGTSSTKKLWQIYFPLKFARFLRIPLLKKTSRQLLLPLLLETPN